MALVKDTIHLSAHMSLHFLEYWAPNRLEVNALSITFDSFNANTRVSITLGCQSLWIYTRYPSQSHSYRSHSATHRCTTVHDRP